MHISQNFQNCYHFLTSFLSFQKISQSWSPWNFEWCFVWNKLEKQFVEKLISWISTKKNSQIWKVLLFWWKFWHFWGVFLFLLVSFWKNILLQNTNIFGNFCSKSKYFKGFPETEFELYKCIPCYLILYKYQILRGNKICEFPKRIFLGKIFESN